MDAVLRHEHSAVGDGLGAWMHGKKRLSMEWGCILLTAADTLTGRPHMIQ